MEKAVITPRAMSVPEECPTWHKLIIESSMLDSTPSRRLCIILEVDPDGFPLAYCLRYSRLMEFVLPLIDDMTVLFKSPTSFPCSPRNGETKDSVPSKPQRKSSPDGVSPGPNPMRWEASSAAPSVSPSSKQDTRPSTWGRAISANGFQPLIGVRSGSVWTKPKI